MHRLNNFILMISISRLKNYVDKNFVELQNQNIIHTPFNKNIKNNKKKPEIIPPIKEILIDDTNIEYLMINNADNSCNFYFNSFINVLSDSFRFDTEDWHLIY